MREILKKSGDNVSVRISAVVLRAAGILPGQAVDLRGEADGSSSRPSGRMAMCWTIFWPASRLRIAMPKQTSGRPLVGRGCRTHLAVDVCIGWEFPFG